MASDKEFVDYAAEKLFGLGEVGIKKMFGEYTVYLNQKPILLVCDNTVFIKQLDCVAELLKDMPKGLPYPTAKECYIIDPDDTEILRSAAVELEKVVKVPVKKAKKKA